MNAQLACLQAHFSAASQVMSELPFFNPALVVETVAFEPFEQGYLGVLITPWCMNLVMVPEGEAKHTADVDVGAKQMLKLPSGQYECVQGYIDGLGGYLSCSLFSPMTEFTSQALAVDTAHEVMLALFNDAHFAPTERQRSSEEPLPSEEQPQLMAEPAVMSRRRFLTAALSDK